MTHFLLRNENISPFNTSAIYGTSEFRNESSREKQAVEMDQVWVIIQPTDLYSLLNN